MRLYLLLIFTLMTTSCANYISKMYNELDGPQRRQVEQQRRANADTKFDQYRQARRSADRPQDRRSFTSSKRSNVQPQVKRQYSQTASPRVTASNFYDNRNDGSLWAGDGNENYLFTKNKWKRNGDIILVNVQTRLKNEITMELKRAFPPMPKLLGQGGENAPQQPGQPGQQAAAGAGAGDDEDKSADSKIHDKISGVIVEEISRDHLLVRGQKNVLFKNRKHLIELQALISRKDINEDDTVNSTKFLESSVTVLR